MLFSAVLASTITFVIGISAARARAPWDDPHYVQLRIYGKPGCFEQNQGEMGIYGNKLSKYQIFNSTAVKSVYFEYALRDNCTVAIYNNITCHLNCRNIQINTCLSNSKEYSSYLVQC
ncbi:hypothetical protein ETB97_008824 [Aspergillus alliaceus]|uniref:Uncharacterized protein n=1 Tax=Petromyces alliaceus TaxID=209559 RepID=A0A8H6E1Y2_PETAA|nr:hypothetical protein ETB97_008824 [Aspergillus burnettii]